MEELTSLGTFVNDHSVETRRRKRKARAGQPFQQDKSIDRNYGLRLMTK